MSLRKSPTRTTAFLAACRSNARKSTGPRTAAGKARTRLNALQHGRYCRKLHRLLPEGLSVRNRLKYQWIQRTIEKCFQPQTPRQREQALRLAVQVWCQAREALGEKRGASGNVSENRSLQEKYAFVLSQRWRRAHFRISVPKSRQSLTFWTRAEGRRPRLRPGKAGKWPRPRAQGLYAGWYGQRIEDWRSDAVPQPDDPFWLYYGRRAELRRERSLRRAEARNRRNGRLKIDDCRLRSESAIVVSVKSRSLIIDRKSSIENAGAVANRQSIIINQRRA